MINKICVKRAEYQIMKEFGTRGREKNGKTRTNQRKTKNG